MKLKIKEIVLVEKRPFCVFDFREFEVGGVKYSLADGTFRNNILKLRKSGYVELAFNSRPAFYTIPGHKFDKSMTLDRMGVTSIISDSLLKETPIYRWLKNRPTQKQSLHNIRMTFQTAHIWDVFSITYPDKIDHNNKDIKLPSFCFGYIDILVTIHHTDTVSVAVSCSSRPIVIDLPDFLQLFEALTRIELYLANVLEKFGSVAAGIPTFRKWIVKMWHFGVDTIDEYAGKEFEVTFEEGMSDVYRIYTKRTRDKNSKGVRGEHQQYPNQVVEALVKKLYPDGHLINT